MKKLDSKLVNNIIKSMNETSKNIKSFTGCLDKHYGCVEEDFSCKLYSQIYNIKINNCDIKEINKKMLINDDVKLTDDIIILLSKELQKHILKSEDNYIVDLIISKTTNEIKEPTLLEAVKNIYNNICEKIAFEEGLLVVNSDDMKKFYNKTSKCKSLRRYLSDFGINIIINDNVPSGEAYFVPLSPEVIVLGRIYKRYPEEIICNTLDSLHGIMMKEKIIFIIKRPELLSKIIL